MKDIYLLPALMLFCYSCNEDRTQEVRMLALKFHKNRCEQLALEHSVELQWLNVLERIEKNMPENISMRDKQNLLDISNTELLASGRSIDSLDVATRYLIREAGVAEREAAEQLKSLSETAQVLELEQIGLFNEIASSNPEVLPKMRELFESISHRPCDGLINSEKPVYNP